MGRTGESEVKDIATLEMQYRGLVPLATRFAAELSSQVLKLAEDNRIPLGFPIQSRVKQWPSIEEKLERIAPEIHDITDLQDLVGLRVILLFMRDVERFSEMLDSTFDIVRKYDTQERLKEDQFGYSSVHVVVRISPAWLHVPTFSGMDVLSAEIQIRTVAQHMWAEVSHLLQYKQKASVPKDLLRSIYRVSALLEAVDLEYDRILEERDVYREQALTDEETQRLNVDLLEKLLDSMLPAENKYGDEDLSRLLTDLKRCGVVDSKGLRELIHAYRDQALVEDRQIAKKRQKEVQSQGDEDTPPERLARGIYFTHAGLVRVMLELAFDYRVSRSGEQIGFSEESGSS